MPNGRRRPPLPEAVAFIKVADARRALRSRRRSSFRAAQVIGAVTGTSGKTSVAAFTRPDLDGAFGHAAASIGTVGLSRRNGSLRLRSPRRIGRAPPLARSARGEGVTHLAIEASSHGLDQRRLDGVRVGGWRLHQSQPRPSRLSPDAGGLPRRQAAPVHGLIEPGGAAVIAGRSRARRCRTARRRGRRLVAHHRRHAWRRHSSDREPDRGLSHRCSSCANARSRIPCPSAAAWRVPVENAPGSRPGSSSRPEANPPRPSRARAF